MLQVSSSVGSSFMWRTRGPWRKRHLSELRPAWMKRCSGNARDGTVLVAASPPTWYLERSILWKETSMRRELWWKRMLRSRSWTASYAGWCEILLQLKFLPKGAILLLLHVTCIICRLLTASATSTTWFVSSNASGIVTWMRVALTSCWKAATSLVYQRCQISGTSVK